MIRCFRSSRCVVVAALVLSAALSVAMFVVRPEAALWINLITVALIFALGVVVGRLVANMVATNANAKLLGILHVDLDPERFIAAYRDIPAKVPANSALHTVTSSYLAAGYAAKGDYALAEQTLFTKPAPAKNEKSNLAIQALIHDNLTEFALLKKDAARAEVALSTLREVLQRAAVLNPDLSHNYRGTAALYEQWLSVLSGKTADEKQLSDLLKRTPVQLRQLEIRMLMGDSYARRKQNGEARDAYAAVLAASGKTHFATDAKRALDALGLEMKH